MLYVNEETGAVEIQKEALRVPEVKNLRDSDKSRGKKYFQKSLDYIYWMYCKKSIYHNLPEKNKKSRIEDLLGIQDCFDYEENTKYLKDFKALYLGVTEVPAERLLRDIIKDIDQLREDLIRTPSKVEVEFNLKIKNEDGDDEVVKTKKTVPNVAEKTENYKYAQQLFKMKKNLEQDVIEEKKNGDYIPLFDKIM